MTQFNLTTERWIPCVFPSGDREELGLLDVLERAGEIREIYHDSPLTTVSLHRILLAILYRVCGVKTGKGWATMWKEGWEHKRIAQYLHQWQDRFDLFSSTKPFLQNSEFRLEPKQRDSVSKLFPELSSGNNAQIFDHSSDRNPKPITPAQAACGLVTIQSFGVGFGISAGKRPRFTNAPLVRGAIVLLIGKSLRDTLLLNLVPRSLLNTVPRCFITPHKDIPAWERLGNEWPATRSRTGIMDHLTWPARCVLLEVESRNGSMEIREMSFGQGLVHSRENIDPMAHTVGTEAGGWEALNVDRQRALWRDAESLFNLFSVREGARISPACALTNARVAMESGDIPEDYPITSRIVSLVRDKKKATMIHAWRSERFHLPHSIFHHPDAIDQLRLALELAEEVGKTIRGSIRRFAQESLPQIGGKADPEKVKSLAASLKREEDYWASLETPFHCYLTSLGSPHAETSQWRRAVKRAATDAFEASLRSIDNSGRTLRAAHLARAQFFGKINNLIPKEVNNDAITTSNIG